MQVLQCLLPPQLHLLRLLMVVEALVLAAEDVAEHVAAAEAKGLTDAGKPVL